MLLKNCTFFNEEFEKEFGDIKIENGKIEAIGFFNEDGVDMSGKIVLPGFVDIHIHGGGGGDFSDGTAESFDKISTYLAKHGVTSFCGTTMTLPQSKLLEILKAARGYAAPKSKLAGINLEGPYIALGKKGAQNAEYVRPCSVDEVDSLIAVCDKIKLITIAPEASDSEEFIRQVSKKMTVSIGHSEADETQCRAAIESGIRHATHLFNAMTPMTHRSAGIVGTVLDSDVTCEVICDGAHICPTVLRNAFSILGEDRACVISDSMRAAGLGSGEFELGGQTVYVHDGGKTAVLADGTIAASVTNLFDEFKNLLSYGIDFKTALKSCTINPAKVIGEDKNIGSIAAGKCADLIIVDGNIEISEVYIDGTLA
ncbi:MAG: N-acetylglucosamine-6-phosphate deacetylase [Ruminococcaceae bacterium]|nr:N-acetylglucosamine-6-phosphate deacetylase [Oscillospiraceae bacterium]